MNINQWRSIDFNLVIYKKLGRFISHCYDTNWFVFHHKFDGTNLLHFSIPFFCERHYFYRPQGKVMFSETCVSNSDHGGGGLPHGQRSPSGQRLPRQGRPLDRPPGQSTHGHRSPGCRPLWKETSHPERTWNQTGSDNIHPLELTSSGSHCSGQ